MTFRIYLWSFFLTFLAQPSFGQFEGQETHKNPDIYVDSKIDIKSSHVLVQKLIKVFENNGYENPLIGTYDSIEVADTKTSIATLHETNPLLIELIEGEFNRAIKGINGEKLKFAPWSKLKFDSSESTNLMDKKEEDARNEIIILESGAISEYLTPSMYESLIKGSHLFKLPWKEARFNYRIHGLSYDFNSLGLQFIEAQKIENGILLDFKIHIKDFLIRADLMSFIMTLPTPREEGKKVAPIASLISGTEIKANGIDNLFVDVKLKVKLIGNKIKIEVSEYDPSVINKFLQENGNVPLNEELNSSCPEKNPSPFEADSKVKLNIQDIFLSPGEIRLDNTKIVKFDTQTAKCFIRGSYPKLRPLIFDLINNTLEGGVITTLVDTLNKLEWDRSYWTDATEEDEYTAGLKSFYFIQEILGQPGKSSIEAYIPSDFCNTENYVQIDQSEAQCRPNYLTPKPKRTFDEFNQSKEIMTELMKDSSGSFVMSMGEDLINRMLFWMAESRFFDQEFYKLNVDEEGKEQETTLSLGPKSIQVKFDEGNEIFKIYFDLKVKLKNPLHILTLGTDSFRIPLVINASAGISAEEIDPNDELKTTAPKFILSLHSIDLTEKSLYEGHPELSLPGLKIKGNQLNSIFIPYIKRLLIKTLKQDIPLILDEKDREMVQKKYAEFQKNYFKISKQIESLNQKIFDLQKKSSETEDLGAQKIYRKKINNLLKKIDKLNKDFISVTPYELSFSPIAALKDLHLGRTTFKGDGHGRINVFLNLERDTLRSTSSPGQLPVNSSSHSTQSDRLITEE